MRERANTTSSADAVILNEHQLGDSLEVPNACICELQLPKLDDNAHIAHLGIFRRSHAIVACAHAMFPCFGISTNAQIPTTQDRHGMACDLHMVTQVLDLRQSLEHRSLTLYSILQALSKPCLTCRLSKYVCIEACGALAWMSSHVSDDPRQPGRWMKTSPPTFTCSSCCKAKKPRGGTGITRSRSHLSVLPRTS